MESIARFKSLVSCGWNVSAFSPPPPPSSSWYASLVWSCVFTFICFSWLKRYRALSIPVKKSTNILWNTPRLPNSLRSALLKAIPSSIKCNSSSLSILPLFAPSDWLSICSTNCIQFKSGTFLWPVISTISCFTSFASIVLLPSRSYFSHIESTYSISKSFSLSHTLSNKSSKPSKKSTNIFWKAPRLAYVSRCSSVSARPHCTKSTSSSLSKTPFGASPVVSKASFSICAMKFVTSRFDTFLFPVISTIICFASLASMVLEWLVS